MIARCMIWAAALLLASAAAVSAQDYLGEDELVATFTGATVSGLTTEGEPWSESFHADGSYSAIWLVDEPLIGRWEVDGDMICTMFPEQPAFDGCWGVLLDGDAVTYVTEHGDTVLGGTLTRE